MEQKRSHKLRTLLIVALAVVAACVGCLAVSRLLRPVLRDLAEYTSIKYGETNDLVIASDGTIHILYSVDADADTLWGG